MENRVALITGAELAPVAFAESLNVNVLGTYLYMRSEIAAMRTRGGGAIVNMSSTAGLQGVAGLSAYCAAKHAVVGLTKAAALASRVLCRFNVLARLRKSQIWRCGSVPIKQRFPPEQFIPSTVEAWPARRRSQCQSEELFCR
jgi:short chain dehydrogenase